MPLTRDDIAQLAKGFAPQIKAEIERIVARGKGPDLDALARKTANILEPVIRRTIRDEIARSVSKELQQRVDALETQMEALFKNRAYL